MAMNLLSGLQYVQQQGEAGRQRGLEDRFNRLAGEAFNAPQDQRQSILGQMASISPQAAQAQQQQFQADEDRTLKQLTGAARYLKGAMDTNNPQAVQGAWRTVLPGLIRSGVVKDGELSPTWDPSYADTVHQVLAMGEGAAGAAPTDVRSFQMMTQGLSPEDREKARRINLGLDGMASNAGYGFDTIDIGDGRPRQSRRNPRDGSLEYYDERYQQWIPLGGPSGMTYEDGQPVATTSAVGSNGARVNIGNDIPAEARAAILAGNADGVQNNAFMPINRTAAPGVGAGRRKEDEAAAVKEAELRKQLEYAPRIAQADADAARQKKMAELGAEREYSGLPQAALSDILDAEDAIGTAGGIQENMARHLGKIDAGTLTFGPLENYSARGRNFTSNSDERSRNFQLFRSDIEKLRNDSLRLNKGVQTEGDAQRALDELFGSLNDPEMVKAAIQRVIEINKRAVALQQARIQTIRQNYAGPQGQGGGATQAIRIQTNDDYNRLPAGALYIDPNGMQRRKR